MMNPESETGPSLGDPGERTAVEVAFAVQHVEPVCGAGRLAAVALIELSFGGGGAVMQMVRVVHQSDGGLACEAPEWRHPASGKWLPAPVMPPELAEAIEAAVLPVATAQAVPRPRRMPTGGRRGGRGA